MPVLWLHQWNHRPLSPDRCLDTEFRNEIQRVLNSFASWAGDKYRVSWVNNLRTQVILPEDCLVYFVPGYDTGAARHLVSAGAPLTQAQRAVIAPSNLRTLGITIPGQPTVSEVHTGKCLQALRQLRRHRPDFTPAQKADYALVLAAIAWHEAMHNKVEPQMGPGWNLHASGGGGWAGTLQGDLFFGPNGGFLGPRQPTPTNLNLMQANFASPVPQFIGTSTMPTRPSCPP